MASTMRSTICSSDMDMALVLVWNLERSSISFGLPLPV